MWCIKAVENGIYTETTNDRIKVLENRKSELKAIIYLENPYNVEYQSFDLVAKQEYVKEYITKCKTKIIARNISIFI